MFFDRNNIKVSFGRPQYQTNGNEVKCTLKYRIHVPDMSHYDSTVQKNGTLNINPVSTRVIFELGDIHTATGVAKCNDEDTFDKQKGRDIAEARAEAKAYKHAAKLVKKHVAAAVKAYADMVLEFEAKADYIQRHNAEYSAELGK